MEKAKDCITLIESNPLEEFDETEQNKAVIRLLQELGTFTEQQMQVCYMMRIGLSKSEIQNMTNLSRATVWRWQRKYDWVHVEGKD